MDSSFRSGRPGRSDGIRVVLADDHQLFRQGLKSLLDMEPGIRVVGEANDGLEVQRVVQEQEAQIVLIDINMPVVDGLSATREMMRENPNLGVIILSQYDEEGHVFQALRVGAKGYMLKSARAEAVADAIRKVANGEALMDSRLLSTVLDEFRRMSDKNQEEGGLGALTKGEINILQLVAGGMANKEIAVKLDIAESTVKNRLSVLFSKIGVQDRTQAAIYAITHGIAPAAHTGINTR